VVLGAVRWEVSVLEALEGVAVQEVWGGEEVLEVAPKEAWVAAKVSTKTDDYCQSTRTKKD